MAFHREFADQQSETTSVYDQILLLNNIFSAVRRQSYRNLFT